MSRSIRLSTRRIGILGVLALAVLCGPLATGHAAAVWSADAAAINAANPGAAPPIGMINTINGNGTFTGNFASGLVLGNGNSYTFSGTFTEIVTPTTAAEYITNFVVTAGIGNVGTISDTMWFFSDNFHPLGPQPGWVGMRGAFVGAGLGGVTQAQMDFNGSFGGLPATSFLTTSKAFSSLAPVTPFARVTTGFIASSTTELTGLLGFTLNPGQSLTFPFDFSDNVNLASIVPEPSSFVLLGLGVIPMALMARRSLKRKKVSTTAHSSEDATVA
jgi:PEP-CTERM motif